MVQVHDRRSAHAKKWGAGEEDFHVSDRSIEDKSFLMRVSEHKSVFNADEKDFARREKNDPSAPASRDFRRRTSPQ
jgi:hypothetical protein